MATDIIFDLNQITKGEFAELPVQENGKLSDEDTAYLLSRVVMAWPYEADISVDGFFDLSLLDSQIVEDSLTDAIEAIEPNYQIKVDLNQATRRDFRAVTSNPNDVEAVGQFMAKVIVEWPFDLPITPESFEQLGLADSKTVDKTVLSKLESVSNKRLGKQSTSAKRYKRQN